jgi:hypothetical protein
LLYGKEISASIPSSGLTKSITAHEHYLSITPDGRIETGPIPPGKIKDLLSAFHGTETRFQEITLPDDYRESKSKKIAPTGDDPGSKSQEITTPGDDPGSKSQEITTHSDDPGSKSHEITLPDNYHSWMREFTTQDREKHLIKTEQSNASLINRDIDNIAS